MPVVALVPLSFGALQFDDVVQRENDCHILQWWHKADKIQFNSIQFNSGLFPSQNHMKSKH